MYTFETQALVSWGRLSDFWEQRLKPEKVNDRRERYLADEDEGEYWRQVFGANKFIIEPESNEPF